MIDPSTLEIQQLEISELQQHPENANNGDLEALELSIEVNGFYSPIIVQESTGYVLAGNHRLLAAAKSGMTVIPGIVIDVTDLEAKRIMVADNRITRLGHDDEAMVANLLEELHATDDGLAGTGYSNDDLQGLLELVNQPLTASDFEQDPPRGEDIPNLSFSIMPVRSEDGKCYELTIARPNYKHITGNDMNALRRAMGLSALTREQLATYDIADWGSK